MTVEEQILQGVSKLPASKKAAVQRYVESLLEEEPNTIRLKSAAGVLADLGIDIPFSAFKEAREEMSKGFPREFLP